MADILYTYKNQVYANITNRCDCSCEFCIRTHRDSVGEADNLWLEKDPTLDEIKAAMDNFDFTINKFHTVGLHNCVFMLFYAFLSA